MTINVPESPLETDGPQEYIDWKELEKEIHPKELDHGDIEGR